MPNAADGRETHDANGNETMETWNSRWEPYLQTRAMDNHVHIVSGVNYGGSIVVSPDGSTLATNRHYTLDPGGIVYADSDLDDSLSTWLRVPIDKEYLQVRRHGLYSELLEPYRRFPWSGPALFPGTSFAGFPIDENRFVDTGNWLGPLWVVEPPWAYSEILNQWIFADEDAPLSGTWLFVTRPE